jgi:hypothetical protein
LTFNTGILTVGKYNMSDSEVGFNAVANTADMDMEALESDTRRKKNEQDELNQKIEAFLGSGGSIDVIEPHVLADPPKKPVSNYGSQPI